MKGIFATTFTLNLSRVTGTKQHWYQILNFQHFKGEFIRGALWLSITWCAIC
jgi:hypothetical protein